MYIIGDDIVTHALVNSDANKIKEFIDYGKSYNSAEGDLITLTDSIKAPLKSLHIYGESTQNGTPTPEAPVEITSIGDDGSLDVNVCGKNLFDMETNTAIYNSCKIKSRTDTSITIESASTGFYIGCGGQGSVTGKCSEKRAIKVKPNTVYVCSHIYTTTNTSATSGFYVQFYDSECNPILAVNGARWLGIRDLKGSFVTPSTARYAVVNVQVLYIQAGDIVTISNIQLEEGSTATSYEPYKSISANLASALPLRSVGDVKDEIVYNTDGTAKVIKRFERLTLNGSENWTLGTTSTDYTRLTYYPTKASSVTVNNQKVKGWCSHYQITTANHTYAENMFTVGIAISAAQYIAIYDTRFNTSDSLEGFKNRLAENPVTFIYELKTPEEIPLTAEETSMLQDLITHTPSTTFYADGADMKVEYYNNKLYAIDARVNTLTEKINAIETALITE